MKIDFNNFLVIDIETVGVAGSFDELDERLQKLWEYKCAFFRDADQKTPAELFAEKAGIFAEFGKIVTIAAGFVWYNQERELSLKVRAFSGHSEAGILNEFNEMIDKSFDQPKLTFCAHNGKEFDYPYIARRMLVNGIRLPYCLQFQDKKPWEINHVDTMDLWKFGDRKSFTSLDLLAAIFDIGSSKSDMDGSMVSNAYYKEDGLDRIAEYCKADVVVTTQLFLRLNSLPSIKEENIEIV